MARSERKQTDHADKVSGVGVDMLLRSGRESMHFCVSHLCCDHARVRMSRQLTNSPGGEGFKMLQCPGHGGVSAACFLPGLHEK